MIHKRVVRYGEYTSQQDREAYGRDVKSTHFRMGSNVDPTITTYTYDYHKFDFDPLLQNNQAIGTKGGQGLIFGTDKLQPNSSYKLDYPPKQGENSGLNKDVIKDLRATHYALGSDPRSFNTIHKQDYAAPALGIKKPNDMTRKMRTQNFKFGDDPPNYQTSAADAYAKRPRVVSV